MLPGPNRMFQLGEPTGDVGGGSQLKRVQLREPLRSVWVTGFFQLSGELQHPSQSVGPLETTAAWRLDIFHFLRDVGRCETLRQRAACVGSKRRLWEHAEKPRQQPVAVNGRMPVETTVEGGRELARRFYVGIGVERVRDFVGIFLVNAAEGQEGETLGLSLVEVGICHESLRDKSGEAPKPAHECMVAELVRRCLAASRAAYN